MKRAHRWWWLGGIAIGAIVLLNFFAAPNNNLLAGSTYNRTPNGYGAWYAYMQQQGMPVKRWQKPLGELKQQKIPTTLLRVRSQLLPGLNPEERQWIEQGNTLVVLGAWREVTAAKYSSMQQSQVGRVKIDTGRRAAVNPSAVLLGDEFGAVVWQDRAGGGKGRAIVSVTPHLGANAYQDYPTNYKYLAQLVSQPGNPVWVDEYIHGYRDADVRERAGEGSWLSYLAQKPLFAALFQATILLLVAIWAHNRRLGQPATLASPIVDNSTAYIEALAAVLQKAESGDFVVETIGAAEQIQLQQALGLGQGSVEQQTLIQAWVQQTGRSPLELEQLLQLPAQKRRLSDKDLLNWLKKWQSVRSYVRPG